MSILKDEDPSTFPFRRPEMLFQRDFSSIHFTDESLRDIRNIIFEREGFDLDSYKDKCVQRRISLRVRVSGCKSPGDYVELLRRDDGEVKRLLNTLTINVTEFFRNRSTFDKLREVVLPDMFSMREKEGTVRIWSAGCASGEEPYSLAIILKEFFPKELDRFNVSIIATDVDEGILKRAEDGIYARDRVAGLDPSLRAGYFEEYDDRYKISRDIKRMVSFRREDVFQEGLHRGYDLVICRNLLIYFSREKQEWVLKEFWKSLNRGGFLVLGRAEILVGGSRRLFLTVCPRERIYRKPF
jgi:chemotaxis protein methyltransferase CheR